MFCAQAAARMSINLRIWRQVYPDAPVPLGMFATVAGAYLWARTAVGTALELLFRIIPVALAAPGWKDSRPST